MNNCRHVQKFRLSDHHSILNPQKWMCAVCEKKENIWACLSCSHVACGRFLDEHIQLHYLATKHPLSMDIKEKYVYCYECSNYVLNDNASGDIKILRNCLQATDVQLSDGTVASRRRSSRVQRSTSMLQLSSRCELSEVHEDITYADLWLRRYYLLANAFNKWKLSTKAVSSTQVTVNFTTNGDAESALHGKRRRHTIAGVTGLRNLGNTCYMNSILQVLRHLHQFSKVFIEDECKVAAETSITTSNAINCGNASDKDLSLDCNASSSSTKHKRMNGDSVVKYRQNGKQKRNSQKCDATKVSLSYELHSLLRIMWSGKMSMVSPHKMLHAVWDIIPFFRGYSQQDAQEFLSEFLDRVQSEMDTQGPFSKNGAISPLSSSPFCLPNSSTSSAAINGDDLVTQVFQGELISQIRCLACGHQSDRREAFVDLSLEFPLQFHTRGRSHNDVCQLEDMLSKFMEVEKLDGRIYACDSCNASRRKSPAKMTSYSEAEKRFLINKLPHVLRLHLKRFMWSDRNSKGKISVNVAFPQRLDVKQFCHPDVVFDCSLYNLSAVVVHHGRGFGSGHYTTYCWNSDANSWVHCNDINMKMVTIDDVYKAQAYILVYTKNFSTENHNNETSTIPTSNGILNNSSCIPKYSDLKRKLNGDSQSSYMWKKRKTTIW